MQQRRLGRSGLSVSCLGLGTWLWGQDTDEHEAKDALTAYVDAGGTLVDTAAGYGDGEAWWNDQVEERGDGEQLFAAIAEAMTALQADTGEHDAHDLLREAHMRQCLRAAKKEGFERIAVVCGAWHLPALQADVTAKADAEDAEDEEDTDVDAEDEEDTFDVDEFVSADAED